jgi:hypothetical protein
LALFLGVFGRAFRFVLRAAWALRAIPFGNCYNEKLRWRGYPSKTGINTNFNVAEIGNIEIGDAAKVGQALLLERLIVETPVGVFLFLHGDELQERID